MNSGVLEVQGTTVPFRVDGGPGRPLFAFAHGAGAGMRSDFMQAVSGHLVTAGLSVCRFDFPYMHHGKRRPDPPALLEATVRCVAEEVRIPGLPLVLGGKSMGGRIASQVAAQGVQCDALVFFGYPLHPPGRPERTRDAHLDAVPAPMLFVQGSRDPFATPPELEAVRRRLGDRVHVLLIDDGDHSFKVRRPSGRTTLEAWGQAASGAARWLRAVLGGSQSTPTMGS